MSRTKQSKKPSLELLMGEAQLSLGALFNKCKELRNECQELREERDGLRRSVETALGKERSALESKEARILREALACKPGWREEARQALGLFKWIECKTCGKLFESGGKRKKHCGEC